MKDKKFIQCVLRLKCDTGSDLETVGMSVEHEDATICIYGDKEEGYALKVSEMAEKINGKWTEVIPSFSQMAALAAILAKEVSRIVYEIEVNDSQEELNEKRSNEVLRYGFEGGIYGQLN